MLELRRGAATLAVVGTVVVASACKPTIPPGPPNHHPDITGSVLELPESFPGYPEQGPTNFGAKLNSRGQIVAFGMAFSINPFGVKEVTFLWDEGGVTRIGDAEDDVYAYDISDRGHVTGGIQRSAIGQTDSFVWVDDELTTLPFSVSDRTYVNERGTVAGTTYSPGSTGAAVWQDGEVTTVELDPPEGWFATSLAREINKRDQVLMQVDLVSLDETTSETQWMLWTVDGEVDVLGADLDSSMTSVSFGRRRLNDRGMVLGTGRTAAGSQRALLWHKGHTTDLGTLGGNAATANALNEWGQVVGVSEDAEGHERPFLWHGGEMIPLDTSEPAGDLSDITPRAINNWGQVVGNARDADNERVPFLWQNGRFVNLNKAAGTDAADAAGDINDSGRIVGQGFRPDAGIDIFTWKVSPHWGYHADA